MKTFEQIVKALRDYSEIGNDPPLKVVYNPRGRSGKHFIFKLSETIHITLYQSSWDGKVDLVLDHDENVTVGPYCLHLTAGNQRWFYQYSRRNHEWEWVGGSSTPTGRVLKTFEAMMNTVGPCLPKENI